MGQHDGGLSLTVPEQLRRWNIFLAQWEKALSSGAECHVMGNMNIDPLEINKLDTLETSSQTYKLITLIDQLKTKIYPHGVKKITQRNTNRTASHESIFKIHTLYSI